ncbi:MAG: tetratricopeptide repeat protein [Henriciella sp.]
MRSLIAITAIAITAACASSTVETAPVIVDAPPPVETAEPSVFDLAMGTVDQLVDAGNEQAAIMRLEQLIGKQDASDDEKAAALYRMAELKLGEGNQVWGGIEALDEFLETYPDHPNGPAASELRDYARGEATSLNGKLEMGGVSPTEEFEYRFRLGEHQEAADIMLANALTPANEYILDMYQIGYLCDSAELTGPMYKLIEPDGTDRTVRFCDFGK